MNRTRILGLAVVAALALCAFAAAATASASSFVAGSYPATIKATSTAPINFYVGGGKIECTSPSLQGSLSAASNTVETEITSIGSCTGPLGTQHPTLKMNGCKLRFESGPGAMSYDGSTAISPGGCGPITLTNATCTYSIYPGSGEGEFVNQRGIKKVQFYTNISGLKYTLSGGCGSSEWKDGAITGAWSAGAENVVGSPIDLFVDAEAIYLQESGPKFAAEAYPQASASTASTQFSWSQQAGTVTCKSGSHTAEIAAASTTLPLNSTFSECTTNAGFNPVVKMNSCHFVLDVNGAEFDEKLEKYRGKLGVSCGTGGDKIEINTMFGSSKLCGANIPAQSSVGEVLLGNTFIPDTGIAVEINAQGMSYTQTGSKCTNASYTDGSLQTNTTLYGA